MARPSRILALTLVVASLTLPAWGGTFTDLPEGSARSALATILSERGILHGVSETEFGGTEPITRYELANLLNNLLDRRDLPFNVVAWSDIPPGHPAMPAVSRVTSMSLMTGVGGRFEGLRPATRAEFVETLVNLLSYRSVTAPTRRKGGALTFADVPPTTETGKMLDRAANFWQIVEAPGRVRFRPFEPVTRFEALDIVARVAVLTDPSLAEPIREALKLAEALPTPTPERPSPAWTPRVEATPTPVRTPSRGSTPEPTAAPTAAPTPSATRTPFWATPAPTPAPPTPVPTPRRPFWTSPEPSAPPSAAPTREPTHEPSARPSPANRSASLLTTKARVGANLVFYYREGIPADPSMLASAEPRSDLQAVFPGALNLDVGGQYWAGAFGGTGGFSTLAPIAVALPDGGGTSLIDLTAHGEGLMKLPLRVPDFEAAAGAGVLVRLINGGGIEYLTTSKTILGLGPVGQLAARPLPALLLNGAVQLYPLAFQMASVSERSTMAMRLAGAWQLGAEYELMRLSGLPVFASVGYNGLLALMLDGSGLQTLQGLSVGAGGKF